MLPDPLVLRLAATVLAATAGDVRGQCAQLSATLRGVRWAAPMADQVRRRLADAEADGLTGSLGLEAAAAHLRAVAATIDDLRAASVRLHAAATSDLRRELTTAPPGPAAEQVGRALADLPDAEDPAWAARANVRAVALPAPAYLRPRPVAPSPAGLVEADLAGVRRLADCARTTAEMARAAGALAVARTAGLGLPALDPYGLAGSRSAAWLADWTGPASPLARAAVGWAEGGRAAGLLVDLLLAADGSVQLLADPRLPLALEVLAALRAGPDALREALAGLSADDRAWLVDVVPGLAGPAAPTPRPARWWWPSWLDRLGFLNGLLQVPRELLERLRSQIDELEREARRLHRAARSLPAHLAAASRASARAARKSARALRLRAVRLQRVDARVPRLLMPDWLRRATARPLVDVPVLRHLSRVGAVGAALGILLDLHGGSSLPMALAKAAAALAAGAAVAALTGIVLAGAPEAAAAVLVLLAATAAGIAAAAAVGHYGPARWAQVVRAGRVVRGFGRTATAGVRRAAGAVTRLGRTTARRLSGLGDALARLRPRLPAGPGAAL